MKVYDKLPADVSPLIFDAAIGDAVCKMLEKICGESVDIVLIINREGTWSKPSFITSMPPEDMEALIVGYSTAMREGTSRRDVSRSEGLN